MENANDFQHFTKTTLRNLQASANNTAPVYEPPKMRATEPNMVSTITGIQDMVGGLAKASIPTSGTRYWQKVVDQDVLIPRHLNTAAACGCIFIVLLLAIAVFK